MRRFVPILLLLLAALHSTPARADEDADARAEMTAALQAQADTHPRAATVPVALSTPTRAAVAPPAKPAAGRSLDANAHVVARVQQMIFGLTTSLAHQTQAAVQAATGQAQGQ